MSMMSTNVVRGSGPPHGAVCLTHDLDQSQRRLVPDFFRPAGRQMPDFPMKAARGKSLKKWR